MVISETTSLLRQKIFKILGLLIFIRLGLYIPVPCVDLDIFSQNQTVNPLFGFAKNLTGSLAGTQISKISKSQVFSFF